MKKSILFILTVTLLALATACSAEETKAQRDARMVWWREARFGMFIHWGVYSVPAGYYHDKPVPHRRMDHEQGENSDGRISNWCEGI